MDYILEQVKEKGIVSIIKQYKEDFECYETYQECMEEIENIDYKIIGKEGKVYWYSYFGPILYFSVKTIKGIEIRNHIEYSDIDIFYVIKYDGYTCISARHYCLTGDFSFNTYLDIDKSYNIYDRLID